MAQTSLQDQLIYSEGGEVELVNHEMAYLRERVCWLLVEMHDFIVGKDQIEAVDAQLKANAFDLVESLRGTHCYHITVRRS